MGEYELIIAIVSVLSLFVFMPATIIRGIVLIQRQKQLKNSKDSVGLKELKSYMEEAVVRATAPLQDRLDHIDQQLNRLADSAERQGALLKEDTWGEEEAIAAREKTVGRAARGQRS